MHKKIVSIAVIVLMLISSLAILSYSTGTSPVQAAPTPLVTPNVLSPRMSLNGATVGQASTSTECEVDSGFHTITGSTTVGSITYSSSQVICGEYGQPVNSPAVQLRNELLTKAGKLTAKPASSKLPSYVVNPNAPKPAFPLKGLLTLRITSS